MLGGSALGLFSSMLDRDHFRRLLLSLLLAKGKGCVGVCQLYVDTVLLQAFQHDVSWPEY